MVMGKIQYWLLRTMKAGDKFYEVCDGNCYEFTCLGPPIESKGQLSWKAINCDGSTTGFLVTEGLEHYGPEIYWEKPF